MWLFPKNDFRYSKKQYICPSKWANVYFFVVLIISLNKRKKMKKNIIFVAVLALMMSATGVMNVWASLRIINGGIIETQNGFEAPIGTTVDVLNGKIL